MWNSELYGNYRNRSFNDIYPEVEQFIEDYHEFNKGILESAISDTAATTTWLLLSARYGNSTVASQNEEQFKLKLFATIFMFGPTWEKRVEIQKAIRDLFKDGELSEDIIQGGKAIYNSALNPSQAVAYGEGAEIGEGTNTMEELKYINSQNTTNYKKSKADAFATIIQLLNSDVTSRYLAQFKKLFLTVVSPEIPLWYVTDLNNTDTEVEDDN